MGSKVVFLSEKAYGIAAQVIETKDDSLGIQLAVSRSRWIDMLYNC